MPSYDVTCRVHVTADTPVQAALEMDALVHDPTTIALTFRVTDEDGVATLVDMADHQPRPYATPLPTPVPPDPSPSSPPASPVTADELFQALETLAPLYCRFKITETGWAIQRSPSLRKVLSDAPIRERLAAVINMIWHLGYTDGTVTAQDHLHAVRQSAGSGPTPDPNDPPLSPPIGATHGHDVV